MIKIAKKYFVDETAIEHVYTRIEFDGTAYQDVVGVIESGVSYLGRIEDEDGVIYAFKAQGSEQCFEDRVQALAYLAGV